MTKRVNEGDSAIYNLKETVAECHAKESHVNQQLAALTNTKSAIKTINQRLSAIQFGFSRTLDRVESLEEKGRRCMPFVRNDFGFQGDMC